MSGSQEMNTDNELSKELKAENLDNTLAVAGTSQSSTHSYFIPLTEAKSKVWKYYAFEVDDNDRIQNNSVVFCQVLNCNAQIGYSKNTTNMSLHLK